MKKVALIILALALAIGMFVPASAVSADGPEYPIVIHKVILDGGPDEIFTFEIWRDLNNNGILDFVSPFEDYWVGSVQIFGAGTVEFLPLVLGPHIVREILAPDTVYPQLPDVWLYSVTHGATVYFYNKPGVPERGCLTICKTSSWDGVGNPPADMPTFTFDITGPGGYTKNDVEVGANACVTISGLDPGEYRIEEDDPGAEWATDPANRIRFVDVVPDGICAEAEFTNTYVPGCLTICKTVEWGDMEPDPAMVFTFDISGPNGYTNNDVVVAPPYECVTINGLYPGEYTIVEDDPGAEWTTDPADRTRVVTVVSDGECADADFTNTRKGEAEVIKRTNGTCDPTIDWQFTLSGPGVNVTDGMDGDCLVDFDGAKLIPGETYTLCELGVPAGWLIECTVDGVPTPPDSIDPTTGDHCWNFSVGIGEKVTFTINNIHTPDGGTPRTPGYWKNWTTCDGKGNQAETAAKNGGWEAGFWLLDDLLPQTIGDLSVNTCQIGVYVLDDRDIGGTKHGGDAAYHLARNLLAAKLNYGAAACTDPAVTQAMTDAQELLDGIDFNGTGDYLTAKTVKGNTSLKELRDDAIELAGILDNYNNGDYCP